MSTTCLDTLPALPGLQPFAVCGLLPDCSAVVLDVAVHMIVFVKWLVLILSSRLSHQESGESRVKSPSLLTVAPNQAMLGSWAMLSLHGPRPSEVFAQLLCHLMLPYA